MQPNKELAAVQGVQQQQQNGEGGGAEWRGVGGTLGSWVGGRGRARRIRSALPIARYLGKGNTAALICVQFVEEGEQFVLVHLENALPSKRLVTSQGQLLAFQL